MHSHVELAEASSLLSSLHGQSSWRKASRFQFHVILCRPGGAPLTSYRGPRARPGPLPWNDLPLLLPILRGKLDSPNVLRFQQLNADFEGIFGKSLLADPVDTALGRQPEKWILDHNLAVNRETMESSDPAAVLVNAYCPGILLKRLAGRVCAVYSYRNDDRKASAATPHYAGNFGFIRSWLHINVRES
jgi:hypothetical protein